MITAATAGRRPRQSVRWPLSAMKRRKNTYLFGNYNVQRTYMIYTAAYEGRFYSRVGGHIVKVPVKAKE